MPEETPIRVLIADDHQLMINGIIDSLENSNFIIAGIAKNGKELIDRYFNLLPDIVLADISMPGLSGLDAVREISRKDRNLKALFLSIYNDLGTFKRCIDAGGLGLIGKDVYKDELKYAMHEVSKGSYYFGKRLNFDEVHLLLNPNIENKQPDTPLDLYLLTPKELEFFEFAGEGLTTDEIAGKMGITTRTCTTHRKTIMEKLNIDSLPQFIMEAVLHLHKSGRL